MSRYAAETFPVGAFQCNCTLLFNADTKQAMVVDPGDEPEEILARIDSLGATVTALWHTHAHLDHVGATLALFNEFSRRNAEQGLPAPRVYLHEGDRWLYENIPIQSALLRLPPFSVTANFDAITDSQTYEGFPGVKSIHTPGHTPGSCCLSVKGLEDVSAPRSFLASRGDEFSRLLISGDTLFHRSIGRTDLWGGDSELILRSIRGRLLSLDPATCVIPGHGPLTTIGEERERNPFLAKGAR